MYKFAPFRALCTSFVRNMNSDDSFEHAIENVGKVELASTPSTTQNSGNSSYSLHARSIRNDN